MMSLFFRCLLMFLCIWLWLAQLNAQPSTSLEKNFHEEVAPILVRSCIECHNGSNAKGGLSLETLASVLKGGEEGPAIVVGKAKESLLYQKIVPAKEGLKPQMPRKKAALTAEEVKKIEEWIDKGARWPKEVVLREKSKADGNFWSLRPVRKEVPPVVREAPVGWGKNPVDAFILAKLQEKGLRPNPISAPRDFIRRATYDLTGLPPTPEEVTAFERDCAKDRQAATANLVDRLLDSPRYGEHWGRHWLDVIRFGESRGYERNEIITNLWPLRDYVIRSVNENKPFDQIIREHLAGDVLGPGKPEIEIASAFLVAGPYDDVGNQDAMAAAQIRADQMDEMIRATSEGFLGLTMGCARCHDHKFDPLLAKDYYALFSTFSGVVHGPREVATPQERAERTQKIQLLEKEKKDLEQQLKQEQDSLLKLAQDREAEISKEWKRPALSRYGTEETFEPVEASHIRLTFEGTDSRDPNQKQPKIDEFEVYNSDTNPKNVALKSNGGVAVGNSREAKDFNGAYGAYLVNDGKFGERWQAFGNQLTISFAKPEKIRRVYFSSDRTKALGPDYPLTTFVGDYTLEVSQDGQAWRKVADSHDRIPPTDVRKTARLLAKVTTNDHQKKVASLNKALAGVNAKIAAVPALNVWWVGSRRPAPVPFQVYVGGSPQKKGDEVAPASLEILRQNGSSYRLEPSKSEADRRLALANWITSRDNPLTSRVLANRIWHYHFGTGIVDTPSDFGFMGGRPTHPELLDWLASTLLDEGWKIKAIHRLIMTSQTYAQSSDWRQDASRMDGDSRYLWRFPPRRLHAEEVRDTMLAIAGKLDLRMGGPGFKLYEYQQDNVATYVPLDVHGPETYRRAVYHHNARASRVDVLGDFDIPDPAFAEPRRASTTTPLQALTLLNHRFSVDMATALAERVTSEAGADQPSRQVERMFQLAFGRMPTTDELARAGTLVKEHGLKAMARVILNSNELINLR
jgi:Protein of unknown function (DUF1553)/Protein of unknown function (DUF1549)/Planctomycete cytochrome C